MEMFSWLKILKESNTLSNWSRRNLLASNLIFWSIWRVRNNVWWVWRADILWIWSMFKRTKIMFILSANTVMEEIFWIIRPSKRKRYSVSKMPQKYWVKSSTVYFSYMKWGTYIEILNLRIFCLKKIKLAIM